MDITGPLSEFILGFVWLCLLVFTISSGWLYSELPSAIRAWWLKTFNNSKIKHLATCQLCCSFWFALAFEDIFIGCGNVMTYIVTAFAVAGISWMMGAFTLMCLNVKWAAEEIAKRISNVK